MSVVKKIVSSFDIMSSKSDQLCLIDPVMLIWIIIIIFFILYLMNNILSRKDIK